MPNNQRASLKKLSVFFFGHFLIFQFYYYLLYFFVSHISNFLSSITFCLFCFVFLFLSILLFSLKSLSQSQRNITKNELIGIIQTRMAS